MKTFLGQQNKMHVSCIVFIGKKNLKGVFNEILAPESGSIEFG